MLQDLPVFDWNVVRSLPTWPGVALQLRLDARGRDGAIAWLARRAIAISDDRDNRIHARIAALAAGTARNEDEIHIAAQTAIHDAWRGRRDDRCGEGLRLARGREICCCGSLATAVERLVKMRGVCDEPAALLRAELGIWNDLIAYAKEWMPAQEEAGLLQSVLAIVSDCNARRDRGEFSEPDLRWVQDCAQI